MSTHSQLLIDSDVFIHLAGADLLDVAVSALGFSLDTSRRLAPLPYMLTKSKRLRGRYSADVIRRAEAKCREVGALVGGPSVSALDALAAEMGIDGGEATLIATLAEDSCLLLTTGDKRALRAFARSPNLKEIRQRCSGRIIAFEQVLLRLMDTLEASRLATALAPLIPGHQTLEIVFSPANIRTNECRPALLSYLNALRSEQGVAELLVPWS